MADGVRVTQQYVEVLYTPDATPALRVTQQYIEVLKSKLDVPAVTPGRRKVVVFS